MNNLKAKCPHGKELDKFCCRCKYGNYGQMRRKENVRDLTDDLKVSYGYKLIKGFCMFGGMNG